MDKPAAIIGQIVLYGAFAAFIGYFATNPTYKQIADDVALIKLSISHLGGRECRKRTPEELAKMPPNMRAPLECPRGRSDIKLVVELDDKPMFETLMHPTGLSQRRHLHGLQALRSQGRHLQARGEDERQPGQSRLQFRQGSTDHAEAGRRSW